MKRFLALALALSASVCCAHAQVVDTTVCDVLKSPKSFDGKIVRIKGTVVVGFDEFIIQGSDCHNDVNAIWLAYPQGTKAKAGPVATVILQPAKNFAGTLPAVSRAPVSLDKVKDFKTFDGLLSTPHNKGNAMCLGCNRYAVSATLVGRLDGVADATIQRDKAGKIIGLGGFGNLNAYAARLVLQSVSDVTSKEEDYSKADAVAKGPMTTFSGSADLFDPVETVQKFAASMSPSGAGGQIQRAANSFPQRGNKNGVNLVFANASEVNAKFEAQDPRQDSPDGVIYNCTISDRMQGDPLLRSIIHVGEHVADIRTPMPGDTQPNLFALEYNAWMITAITARANRQASLALGGGYLIWNQSWPDADLTKNVDEALTGFLNNEAQLVK